VLTVVLYFTVSGDKAKDKDKDKDKAKDKDKDKDKAKDKDKDKDKEKSESNKIKSIANVVQNTTSKLKKNFSSSSLPTVHEFVALFKVEGSGSTGLDYDDLTIVRLLRHDGYAAHYKGLWRDIPACISVLNSEHNPLVKKELQIACSLHHINVMHLLGYTENPEAPLCVVAEYVSDTLDEFVRSRQLPESDKMKICLGISKGLRYLHAHR
jgi:hypothetical protein